MKLYHCHNARSFRPLWTLEELGLDYELVVMPFPPRARVEGAPGSLLRWLWGRAGDDAVRVTGDPAWADYLRRMLIAATQ